MRVCFWFVFEQRNEAKRLFAELPRLLRVLCELVVHEQHYAAACAVLPLLPAVKHRLWPDSPHVSRQLPGIGDVMSTALGAAGLTTMAALANADAARIEAVVGRNAPFGSNVLQAIGGVPQYRIDVDASKKATPMPMVVFVANGCLCGQAKPKEGEKRLIDVLLRR